MSNADNQLDVLATNLKNLEPQFQQQQQLNPEMSEMLTAEGFNAQAAELEEAHAELEETECVLELLESVCDVTNDYESLRKELSDLQQQQKELNSNLHNQVQVMKQTFVYLKKRIEANSLQPHIKQQFLNNNQHQLHNQLAETNSNNTKAAQHKK